MNAPQKTIMNANLFSRLFDTLDDPARLAIETTDGQRINDGELISRAGQMANVLVSRGVKPGDRVAAQTEKSVPGLVLYLAAVRAGAVYLPLNTAYTLNELEYFIGDAEPSLVVCDPARAEGIGAIAAKVGAKVETLDADGKGSLTEAAAKAPADGHTLLLVTIQSAVNEALYERLNYNFLRDIAPVASISSQTLALEVTPSFPASQSHAEILFDLSHARL